MKRVLIITLGLAGALLAIGLAASASLSTYNTDPAHSAVVFRIKHAMAGYIWGRFDEFSGVINIDEENPAASQVSFTVQASSIDTNVEARDNHLRSADFFNVEQFPVITFTSTGLSENSDGSYTLTGDLSLLGNTQPITAQLYRTGEADDKRGHIRGFEARFNINRSDFGMNYGLPGIADEVELFVNTEAILQP